MNPFTKVPNDVLLDATLVPGARVAYAVLRHLAWQAGRREEDDEVALPNLATVADAVGCSRSTVKTYLAEFRRRGLVETRRISNQGMVYRVFDAPRARSESGPELGQNLAQLRRETTYGPKTTTEDKNNPPTPRDLSRPPAVVLVDGRNLALDALMDECGIVQEETNHRVALAAVALNGRARPREPGIRDAFWTECVRQAHARFPAHAESVLTDLHDDPHLFQGLLTDRIRHKAARYRSVMPGVVLTPKALRDWWFDIETRRGGDALTAADLERLAHG